MQQPFVTLGRFVINAEQITSIEMYSAGGGAKISFAGGGEVRISDGEAAMLFSVLTLTGGAPSPR